MRIDDDTNDFVEMQCLGNRCEFAQGQPPPCRPWMRVVFLLTHWGNGQSLPGVLAKFTSGGWQTYQNFLGFFEQIQTAAQQIGIENPNLTGYPLTLHHLYKTKPEKRIKYQVIEVYPRKSPYEFLAEQTKLIKSIRSEYGELEAITDQTQQQPQVVFEDQKSIEWPRSKEQ